MFNGDPKYVSGYQGAEDATLNYPMYYKLKNAFQSRQTMRNIHDGVQQNSVFRDTSVLGNFLDNHDNPRFLSANGDTTVLMNALTYVIFGQVQKLLIVVVCVCTYIVQCKYAQSMYSI